jgi:low affinity Fe/Cu permease
MSDQRPNLFDRFADKVNGLTSQAWFFVGCLLLVVIWAPSFLVTGSIDTWQLLINTPTTVITFLLVALQQNSQTRADAAIQEKVNMLAKGVAALLVDVDEGDLARELRRSVGLENREST